MKSACILLASVAALLAVVENSLGADLAISIRSHAQRVTYGDPLFLEVAIVNHAKEPVYATRPNVEEGNVEFRAREPETGMEFNCSGPYWNSGDGAPSKPVLYLPGISVKHRCCVFLPYTHQLHHPFWKAVHESGTINLWVVLWLERHLGLKCYPITILVKARDPAELKILDQWSRVDQQRADTDIYPFNFGIPLYAVNTRQKTKEVAERVKSGELAELLQLIVQIQQLADSPDAREAESKRLVDWIRKQPDIKRQVLAKKISDRYHTILGEAAMSALNQIAEPAP